jgi:hypothetical protein
LITRQLQADEVLYKLSTMNDKSSFVKVPVVITKPLKLYFNNSSRIPTQEHRKTIIKYCIINFSRTVSYQWCEIHDYVILNG